MNYDNKKKNCFLLSSFTELEDKRGWTAGLVEAGPPPTLPTTGPSTYPPTETPVTGATTEGGCEDKFFKNKAYETSKATLMGRPEKSASPDDCLDTCKVQIESRNCRHGHHRPFQKTNFRNYMTFGVFSLYMFCHRALMDAQLSTGVRKNVTSSPKSPNLRR